MDPLALNSRCVVPPFSQGSPEGAMWTGSNFQGALPWIPFAWAPLAWERSTHSTRQAVGYPADAAPIPTSNPCFSRGGVGGRSPLAVRTFHDPLTGALPPRPRRAFRAEAGIGEDWVRAPRALVPPERGPWSRGRLVFELSLWSGWLLFLPRFPVLRSTGVFPLPPLI